MTYPFSGSKVDTLWLQGDREEAVRQSRLSRRWNIAGMVTGAVIFVTIVAIYVISFSVAFNTNNYS